jgi:hypothetical protein
MWQHILSYVDDYDTWRQICQVNKKFHALAHDQATRQAVAKRTYQRHTLRTLAFDLQCHIIESDFCPVRQTKCRRCKRAHHITVADLARKPVNAVFSTYYNRLAFAVLGQNSAQVYDELCELVIQATQLDDQLARRTELSLNIFYIKTDRVKLIYWLCLMTLLQKERPRSPLHGQLQRWMLLLGPAYMIPGSHAAYGPRELSSTFRRHREYLVAEEHRLASIAVKTP